MYDYIRADDMVLLGITDLFVRVVERRVDGVVIRGAKMHQTGTINSHWLLTMPGGRMVEGDEDYAAICAVPVDAAGLTYIYGRQSCDTRSLEVDGTDIDQGNSQFGARYPSPRAPHYGCVWI